MVVGKHDKNFVEQFFMTHEYFITKDSLLTCLVNEYPSKQKPLTFNFNFFFLNSLTTMTSLKKRSGAKPWESKHRER